MKIKTLIAASGLAAAGIIGGVSQSASAGCGLNITVDNDESTDVTVNWTLSKVRSTVPPFGVAGTWASIGNSSTNVDANTPNDDDDEYTKAITGAFGCGEARQYKIHVSDGSNTWWEYFPSSTLWTNNESPFINLDR